MKIKNLKLKIGLTILFILFVWSFSKLNKKQTSVVKPLTFQRQFIGEYQYKGEVKGVMKASFGQDKDGGRVTINRNKSKLEFGLPINNSTIIASSGNTLNPEQISFKSDNKIIEAKYSLVDKGLKEEIVLNKIPAENKLPISLKTENLKMKITSDGIPVFYDDKDQYQFHFERPFMKDGAGNVSYGVNYLFGNEKKIPGKNVKKLIAKSIEQTTSVDSMIIEIDSNWLHDPKRVLPIIIDPTVVHDTSAEFATGQQNRVKNTGTTFVSGGTGGTITTSGGYTIHTFTTSGTFTPTGSGAVEYLVVGAGGGGNLGGGGGGGVRTGTYSLTSGVGYTVTIGAGTAGAAGGNSVFDTITATGGGQGGTFNQTGFAGGSGGGGGENDNQAGTFAGGAGTAGQGNNGGTTFQTASPNGLSNGAGGGGAGAVGGNSPNGKTGGTGGAGTASSISGASVTYGGGGGGGATTSTSGAAGGAGGSGGGGTGAAANNGVDTAGAAGTANTGGGGGGGNNGGPGAGTLAGYAGGSGIVIVRYPTTTSPTLETFYQELPKDEYTVGLWHMNEASNGTCAGGTDTCDSSDKANHLTRTNTSIDATGQRIGSAARSFNGTSDYLSIADNASLSITSNLTWEAWIKATTTGDDRTALIKRHSTTGFPALVMGRDNTTGYGTSGRWNFAVNVVTCGVITTTNGFDTNWHHIAGTYDGSTQRLYIDGVLSASGACSTSLDTDGAFQIGAGRYNTSAANYFPGIIDEVRISNIARTPEEIKSAASRRPYSVFTSDVVDISNVTSWNSLTWTELGVNTGDGETLKDTTSLVAQWNLNETSGTTADNAEGTAALDGTLTNFASTSSQDQAAGTGWTSANRRWGAGALMFDGINDYITVSDNNALDFGTADFSLEAWVNTTTAPLGQRIIYKYNSDTTRGYMLYLTYGKAGFLLWSAGANQAEVTSSKIINDGSWHHLVGLRKNSVNYLYVDGKLEGTATGATSDVSGSSSLYIGSDSTPGLFHNGIIDSARVYSRALTAAEILSNYNSSNIEFQTRVGSDNSPDDGSWEAWKPTTNETAIDSFDGPYQYPTSETGLVAYWPFDSNANDVTGGFNLSLGSSDTLMNGLHSNGMNNNGSGAGATVNYSAGNALDFTTSSTPTISFWINKSTTATSRTIVTPSSGGWGVEIINANLQLITFAGASVSWSNVVDADSKWHFFAVTYDGANARLYKDGQLVSAQAYTAGWTSSARTLYVGGDASFPLTGKLDELRIYNTVLSATTIQQLYLKGSTNANLLRPSTDLVYKMEGSASQKIQTGQTPIDTNTVGLWHLDETGGTGAYIKDSTTNANHGTPTGTTIVNGISSKARNFNGTSDYIDAGSSSTLKFTLANNFSISGWIYTVADSTDRVIAGNGWTTNGYHLRMTTANKLRFIVIQDGSNYKYIDSAATISAGWHHATATWNGSTVNLYVDGVQTGSQTTSGTVSNITSSLSFYIGNISGQSQYYKGNIDELKVSNLVLSAEEVAEAYRAGRDHYINKTISSTDLSGKQSLPFYVAADRPGTYLQTTIGESAFVNYQADINTVGLWHLDEQSGSGAYIKDSSGNGYHGTPTGTTFVQGKVGKAKNLNGTSDRVSISNINIANSSFTIQAWAKRGVTGVNHVFLGQGAYGTNTSLHLGFRDTNVFMCAFYSNDLNTSTTFTDTNWHLWTCTYDASTNSRKLYQDGVLIASDTASADYQGTGTLYIGSDGAGGSYFNGLVDEVRIDNTVRTATEIRQAYEVGLRTHPITIDFGAKLDSGDLITGSGDLGFTVDATYYGLNNKGSNLFLGDKIIVKENYDGTEYMAQGDVTSVNLSTGAVTIDAWDAGGTFPSGGYTVNASVFKWQREYWNINNETLDSHTDAITNLTLRLTDGSEGRTVWLDDLKSNTDYLTTPGGSTITSSTGNRYFQYRSIIHSFDEAVSATLSAVTIDYTLNAPPNTPTLNWPLDTATNRHVKTKLITTATDTDSDYVRYKIEICTNVGMTIGCQTYDQTVTQTGWSGQNTQSNTAYTSGTAGQYTIQTPLAANTTYYWRSYAIDPGGTNQWSATQGTPYSFTTRASANTLDNYCASRTTDQTTTTAGWAAITGTNCTNTIASTNGWVDSNNLTPGDRYLIMAWGTHNTSDGAERSGIKVTHGGVDFTESVGTEETDQTGAVRKTPYFWFTVWTAVSGEDLEMQYYLSDDDALADTGRTNNDYMVVINAEWLIANGDLKYNVQTAGGTLTATPTAKSSITWTPRKNNDNWWIMAYSQADIFEINADQYRAQLDIDGVDKTAEDIEGEDLLDTPTYGLGWTQALSNSSHTAAIEIYETAADQEWDSAGIFALNLNVFENYVSSTNASTSLSVQNQWVQLNRVSPNPTRQGNWLFAGGGLMDDNTGVATGQLQHNDTTTLISENGGWQANAADVIPSTLGYVYQSLPTGSANIDYDGRILSTTAATALDTWLIGFSMEYIEPIKPNTPSLDLPTDAATNQALPTILKTTAIDLNNDYLRYKIELCGNLAMTTNCQTFDQTSSQTGWSGQNTQTNTAYTSGTQATYTIQSPLLENTTYYWRSYAIDPADVNSWSSTQVTPYSFSTSIKPVVPSLNIPINGINNQLLLPVLKTTTTDPNSDYLRYKIQICTDIFMTTGCQTHDQTSSQTGWSGQNTQTNTAYTSGTQATYTRQSVLNSNSTYYWRSYAIDPGGSNSWSSTQTTPYVFYTMPIVPPSAPTALLTNGSTNPTGVLTSVAPYFSAIHNDLDNQSANYYQIVVSSQPDVNGAIFWDSGQTAMSTTANGNRSPNITYAGIPLSLNGQMLYWKIRFWDTGDNIGEWSTPANFTLFNLTSSALCTAVKNNTNTQIIISWIDQTSVEDGYYIEKNTDGGGFTNLITKAAGSTSHTDSSISSSHSYQYRIRATNGSNYSDWCTTNALNLGIGNFKLDGLQLNGMQIY